eukprot:m.14623 g.14623  ORF g.14623 m.14623 type:complete len:463 (-) comp5169_c0_seq1:123-1511(-)
MWLFSTIVVLLVCTTASESANADVVLWTYEAPSIDMDYGEADALGPMGTSGIIYVEEGLMSIVSVDEKNGELRWNYTLPEQDDIQPVINDGPWLSPDGSRLLYRSDYNNECYLNVFDTEEANIVCNAQFNCDSWVKGNFKITPNSKIAFVIDDAVNAIDLSDCSATWSAALPGTNTTVDVSEDSSITFLFPASANFTALDTETGNILWDDGNIHVNSLIPNKKDNRRVFVLKNESLVLSLINPTDGSIVWEKDFNGSYPNKGVLSPDGKFIALLLPREEIVLLDSSTGDEIWRQEVSRTHMQYTPSFDPNGVYVFLPSSNDISAFLVETGAMIWSVKKDFVYGQSYIEQIKNKNFFYVISPLNFYAMNASNGAKIWERNISSVYYHINEEKNGFYLIGPQGTNSTPIFNLQAEVSSKNADATKLDSAKLAGIIAGSCLFVLIVIGGIFAIKKLRKGNYKTIA